MARSWQTRSQLLPQRARSQDDMEPSARPRLRGNLLVPIILDRVVSTGVIFPSRLRMRMQ